MTVYVDDWRQQARVGRIDARWSHLTVGPGDDLEELHAFAARIGLRRTWFQDKPWPRAHYDLTGSKRQQAIATGATPITWREAGQQMLQATRERKTREARQATRLLVTGSRNWPDPAVIRDALTTAAARHPGQRLILVHGKCDPRHAATGRVIRWSAAEHLSPAGQLRLHGADWLADRTARHLGWDVEQHPADWDSHTPAPNTSNPAGMIRNTDMVNLGAAECLAFICNRSPGASHAASLAERHGIPVHRHEVTTAEPEPTPGTSPRPQATGAPAAPVRRESGGWAETTYGFRSGPRTCNDPHPGQTGWHVSQRTQDAGNGHCHDGHPLAGPLCQTIAQRLAAAGISPDDPGLAALRQWNAAALARRADREAGT